MADISPTIGIKEEYKKQLEELLIQHNERNNTNLSLRAFLAKILLDNGILTEKPPNIVKTNDAPMNALREKFGGETIKRIDSVKRRTAKLLQEHQEFKTEEFSHLNYIWIAFLKENSDKNNDTLQIALEVLYQNATSLPNPQDILRHARELQKTPNLKPDSKIVANRQQESEEWNKSYRNEQ